MIARRVAIIIAQTACLALPVVTSAPTAASVAPQQLAAFQRTTDADPPILLAQGGLLAERIRRRREQKMHEVERELEKNPNLIDDHEYLARHPKLAEYLKRHPEAKSKIKSDPKAFFDHLGERGSQMNE